MIMIFRQLFDTVSSTYTYLLGCEETSEAIIIDPVFEQFNRDSALIRELKLNIRYVLDTHVHADHVTSAWLMKKAFGATIVLSRRYNAEGTDLMVDHGDVIAFGNHALEVRATPGHTNGCVTYITTDCQMAFTGDSLMIRGAGRTDFQSGDVHALWDSIRDQIFSLPDDCLLYPGHDYQGRTVTTVAEEKRFNPRIGGDAREEDFAGFMNNLGLPHPKQLAVAVPANMQCGKPQENSLADNGIPAVPDWGPVSLTFAGVPEIRPDWVARNLDQLTVIDVRSAGEYSGELGHLSGSLLIPLDELRSRLEEIPDTKPLVTVCQSGKRSAMAAQILLGAGFEKVANIPGGLIHWNHLALPAVDRE